MIRYHDRLGWPLIAAGVLFLAITSFTYLQGGETAGETGNMSALNERLNKELWDAKKGYEELEAKYQKAVGAPEGTAEDRKRLLEEQRAIIPSRCRGR